MITVENISKKYKSYKKKSDRIIEWLSNRDHHTDNWVLRNVSFSVKPGESLGIIGHNGAGKSTLLKILTGTTSPTTGVLNIEGNVAALLELGIGFQPEFTGHENVYMVGQLMGWSNEQIAGLIPSIREFSEIGDYYYRPLKTYSSGMAVRLAFSAATAIRPDILIVDEALSVGDAYFQHKCFQRIRKFKSEGTTLLFVSHDLAAVKSLCDRALLLDHGIIIKEGPPDVVTDYYNAIIAKTEEDYKIRNSMEGQSQRQGTRSGTLEAEILDVRLNSAENDQVFALEVNEKASLSIKIKFHGEINNPTIGFLIKDRLGNDIFGTNTFHLNYQFDKFFDGDVIEVNFAIKFSLGVGSYSISVAVHEGAIHVDRNYDWQDQAYVFQIVPNNRNYFVGVANLPVKVTHKEE